MIPFVDSLDVLQAYCFSSVEVFLGGLCISVGLQIPGFLYLFIYFFYRIIVCVQWWQDLMMGVRESRGLVPGLHIPGNCRLLVVAGI